VLNAGLNKLWKKGEKMTYLNSQNQRGGFRSTVKLPDAELIYRMGYVICVIGVFLPLFWIGIKKFTYAEIEAVKPLMAVTPWIAWLPRVLGDNGASYFLGIVEVPTSLLFLASLWSGRAGIVAGALGAVTFAVTSSILTTFPIWNAESGGFPWINHWGAFLIKDIGLLGISILVLADGLKRLAR